MSAFAVLAGSLGVAAFLLLTLVVIILYRQSPLGRPVLLAGLLTSAWMAVQVAYYLELALPGGIYLVQVLEVCRNVSWVYVLGNMLSRSPDRAYDATVRTLYWAFGIAAVVPVIGGAAAVLDFSITGLRIDYVK